MRGLKLTEVELGRVFMCTSLWCSSVILIPVILKAHGLMDGFPCSAPHHSGFHAGVSVCRLQPLADTFGIACAVQPVEAGQGDASVRVDVAVGPLVHPLDQVLLVQQRVVGAQRAGGVVEALVVMAELRPPAGRQELVDVHHLAQRHHHDGAYAGERRQHPGHV